MEDKNIEREEYSSEYAIGSKAISKQDRDEVVTIEDIYYSLRSKCWKFEFSYDKYCIIKTMSVSSFEDEFEPLYS